MLDHVNEKTGLVDEGRTADVVYLLSKLQQAFNSVSHNIPIDKLMKYGLDKWTVN